MARRLLHTGLRLSAALTLFLGTATGASADDAIGGQPAEAVMPLSQSKPFPSPSALGPPVLQRPSQTPPPAAEVAPPAFQVKLGITGEEKATDNALSTSKATRADLITSVTPSVAASYKTEKLDLNFNYDLGYDRYAFTPGLDGVRHNGLGVADAELIDRVLFIDSRFSVTEQPIDPTGPTTADNRTTSTNRTRVTTFSITPRLEQRLGQWAIGQISYRHDEIHNSTPSTVSAVPNTFGASQGGFPAANLADGRADTGKVEIRSGEEFSRLLWDYSGVTSHQLQGNQVLDQNTHDIGAEYRLDSDIGILADVGHDDIHGDQIDSRALSGVFFSGGLHWTPSPDTDLRVGWGKRNGSDNFYLLGEHKFSPMTVLRVSSRTNITTDAMAAIETLNAVQRDPNGNFVDPFSGNGANPGASSFTRSNAVYRQTLTSAALSHTDDRETISVTGSMAEQTVVGGLAPGQTTIPGTTRGTDSTTVSMDLQWAHRLSPATSFSLFGGEDNIIESNAPDGKSLRYRAGLGLTYQMNPLLTAYIGYRFVDFEPTHGAGTMENMIFVGIKRTF